MEKGLGVSFEEVRRSSKISQRNAYVFSIYSRLEVRIINIYGISTVVSEYRSFTVRKHLVNSACRKNAQS